LTCTADPPVCIFTDGAVEGEEFDRVTIGAVFLDKSAGVRRFFGCAVPSEVVRVWQESGRRQVIGQAEILLALLSTLVWRHLMLGRRIVRFVDNEAARMGFIKGYAGPEVSSIMLARFWAEEVAASCFSWFERVPSLPNVADAPSRLEFGQLLRAGYQLDSCNFSALDVLDESWLTFGRVGRERVSFDRR